MLTLLGELPLGIEGTDILLHAANLLILVVVLGLLVYKPVRKFMKDRQDSISSQIAEGERKNREAEQMRDEYRRKLDGAIKEAGDILAENNAKGESERAKIIAMAQKTADEIIAEAKERAEKEALDAVAEVRKEVVGIAFDIASDLLEREISEEDNQKLIDACMAEWEKKHE